jgi:hypothetical protein
MQTCVQHAARRVQETKQTGLARFVKVREPHGRGHEINLWIVGDAGGFQVLRFSDEFLRTKRGRDINEEATERSDDSDD